MEQFTGYQNFNYKDVHSVRLPARDGDSYAFPGKGWATLIVYGKHGRRLVVDVSDYGRSWSEADKWVAENILRKIVADKAGVKVDEVGWEFGSFQGAYALCFVPNTLAAVKAQGYVLKAKNGDLILIENVPEGE